MAKKYRDSLTGRDIEILKFIWRWKLVNSATIFYAYYPTMKARTAYNKLQKVMKRGYIKKVYVELIDSYAWTLTPKGFRVVVNGIPELKNEIYKPHSVNHDFVASAFQMGNWIYSVPKDCSVISEQKLRACYNEFLPDWYSGNGGHICDGVWRLGGGETAFSVALEVELHDKAKSRYPKVQSYYDGREDFRYVVWVVSGKAMANRILRRMTDNGLFDNKKHNFILAKDVLKKSWDSKFILGPLKGILFHEFMDQNSDKSRVGDGAKRPHKILVESQLKAVSSDGYEKLKRCEQD